MNEEMVVVGIFFASDEKHKGRVVKKEAALLDTFEIKKTMKALVADHLWKPNLIERCKECGYEVRAVSVLRHKQHGCDVAVTVIHSTSPGGKLSRAGKPVTRGGQPIGPPVTGKKTMASKRR